MDTKNLPTRPTRRNPYPHLTDFEIAAVVNDWLRWGRLSSTMELAITQAVRRRRMDQIETEVAA